MSEEKHSLRERLAPMLPKFLMILLILQPLMDILSFWTDRLGMSNTITLLLRFAVFAVVCVLGFVTSSRKKVYGIAIAACAFLLVGHCISCFIVGYQRIVYDLTNFVRVVQMPLFVLCFISFLRANNKCYRAFETGLMLDFWIITASVVVSVLTHTSSATYQSTNVGILGWYSFGNAQSAIMSILAPIVILLCYRRKNFLLFTVTSVAALAQLYLMGTRLAFFSIAVAALGVPIVLVLTEGGFTVVNSQWGIADVVVATASPAEVEGRLRLVSERGNAPAAAAAGSPAESTTTVEDGQIRSGDLIVDTNGYTASLHGRPIDLAYKEFELLKYLVQHPGRVFTRAQLLQEVWGYDYYGGTRTVDVHIRRLRAKLGGEYEHLIGTVRNVGYRFDPPEEDEHEAAAKDAAKASSAAIDTDDDTPDLNTVA